MSILHQFIQEAEMSAELATNVVSFREARARRIRELASQWAENTVQMGKELREVRDSFPVESPNAGVAYSRPGWPEWCKENLGFSSKQAARLIRVAETFGKDGVHALRGSAYLLDYLASETVPDAAREEVIARIDAGEAIGRRTAEKIVREHTAPKPEEARKIARETGKPTQASDGNIYLGATKEQEEEAEARRKTVYDLRRAVETFAHMKISAEEFLSFALPHQLWNKEEEYQLHTAYEWLTDLVAAWERR